MTLKSIYAEPSGQYSSPDQNWNNLPPDGVSLGDAYAWEERRVAAMRKGLAGPISFIWVPGKSISLSRREAARLNLDGFDAEPIAVRGTGGTAVPQGPGTANITLFTRHHRPPDITRFYGEMCTALQRGFDNLGLETTIGAKPGSFCDGDFNILLDGKKLAGTAQRWCRAQNGDTVGCHHVVVLTGGDPVKLCARLEGLYAFAQKPETYAPEMHSSKYIDLDNLRGAMALPLSNLSSVQTSKSLGR